MWEDNYQPRIHDVTTTIDVYVSDFGEVRVVADRILRSSGRTTHIVDTEMWHTAMLRPFQVQDLAKTGDAEIKQLLLSLDAPIGSYPVV